MRRGISKCTEGGNMKRIISFILFFACIFSSTACAPEKQLSKTDGYTFKDDLGREITVNNPQRVAVLLGSFVDIWLLAGGSVLAAPADAWEDYNFDLPKDTVNLGGTKELNLEMLLAAKPDFVIASANSAHHLEWKETLEKANIITAYFKVSGFADYLRMLKICTDITGNTQTFQTYGTSQQERIDEIVKRCKAKPKQKVLLLRASAANIRAKSSRDNVAGEMLLNLGCINIADSRNSLLDDLNIESILLQDPEKIFIVEVADNSNEIRAGVNDFFDDNPLWKELTAVQNGQVYFLDKNLYNMKPNARWAEAYEKLEQMLYGEE